jgi:predicted nucleotidyltransferase
MVLDCRKLKENSKIDRHFGLGRLKVLRGKAVMVRESRDLRPDIARPIQIAREVAGLARSILGKDVEVIWFGSWPRGQARPHSDIDVAVSTGKPIPPERMARLHEAVDELPTLYDIDIMDLSAIGSALREEILEHGERL